MKMVIGFGGEAQVKIQMGKGGWAASVSNGNNRDL